MTKQMQIPSFPPCGVTFETSDLDESLRYVTQASMHTLQPLSNRAQITLRHWGLSLSHVHLDYVDLTCGSEFYTEKMHNDTHYFFQFPISGTCELEINRSKINAGPGQTFVLNSAQNANKRWIGQCQQLMMRIDKSALNQSLTSELRHDCRKPLIFENIQQNPTAGQALQSLAFSTWQELALHGALEQWRIARTLEQSLLIATLGLLTHNYSEEFCAPVTAAAPYYVKRAEDYIRANLHDPIEIEELVNICGVSSRSLYYGFQRWRSTTPMSYLRNIRLNVAHEELRNASNSGKRVTDIALDVGYDHLSRFSRDYKLRFGESPSTTIKLSR